MTPAVAAEVERYLRTGRTDANHRAWPSASFMERHRMAHQDLRGALVAEVLRRSRHATVPSLPTSEEARALTLRKTEAMVRGLFSKAEQDTVLALVERSVVFVTPANIADMLDRESFDGAAWHLANLYLGSVGAELLSPEAPALLGMSQGTTCLVTPAYFEEDEPFADFIVHEVAHVFHSCKREVAGLSFTRNREWLLELQFQKRETFAYACEALAWIVERARRPADRIALAGIFGRQFRCGDERVDRDEVADIVLEAAGKRHGWKVILARCSPPPRRGEVA